MRGWSSIVEGGRGRVRKLRRRDGAAKASDSKGEVYQLVITALLRLEDDGCGAANAPENKMHFKG